METINKLTLAHFTVLDVNSLKQLIDSFFKVGMALEQQIDLEATATPTVKPFLMQIRDDTGLN